MKKLFFLTFMLLVTTLSALAQSQMYYALYPVGKENSPASTHYKIDRAAKKFYFDSDSPSDANMLIKNYKKAGSKETFDLYPEVSPNEKIFHVEFNGDANGKQTITFSVNGSVTENYVVGTKQQQAAQSKQAPSVAKPKASAKATPASKTNSKDSKSNLKKTLDKGANLFKKKK